MLFALPVRAPLSVIVLTAAELTNTSRREGVSFEATVTVILQTPTIYLRCIAALAASSVL